MVLNITVSPTALDCIAVRKTGGYATVSRCVGTARVLCETSLVSKT